MITDKSHIFNSLLIIRRLISFSGNQKKNFYQSFQVIQQLSLMHLRFQRKNTKCYLTHGGNELKKQEVVGEIQKPILRSSSI